MPASFLRSRNTDVNTDETLMRLLGCGGQPNDRHAYRVSLNRFFRAAPTKRAREERCFRDPLDVLVGNSSAKK